MYWISFQSELMSMHDHRANVDKLNRKTTSFSFRKKWIWNGKSLIDQFLVFFLILHNLKCEMKLGCKLLVN
jgi:hypothetical protein